MTVLGDLRIENEVIYALQDAAAWQTFAILKHKRRNVQIGKARPLAMVVEGDKRYTTGFDVFGMPASGVQPVIDPDADPVAADRRLFPVRSRVSKVYNFGWVPSIYAPQLLGAKSLDLEVDCRGRIVNDEVRGQCRFDVDRHRGPPWCRFPRPAR